jgi:hypothetical protein
MVAWQRPTQLRFYGQPCLALNLVRHGWLTLVRIFRRFAAGNLE